MKKKNHTPFKIGIIGLETDLAEKPTYWQVFLLIAMVSCVFAAIIIVAIITFKSVVFDILSVSGFASALCVTIRRLFKPRSP